MSQTTYGDQACLLPDALARDCANSGLPAPFAGLANSFHNPLGCLSGQGWLLLRRASLDALDLNAGHDLVMALAKEEVIGAIPAAQAASITHKSLHIVVATCVWHASDGEANNAYLVELADRRRLCRAVPISKAYNVLSFPEGTSYWSGTLNAGMAWTWDDMVEDIWLTVGTASDRLGPYPGLPFTPDGSPVDMDFYGWLALDALAVVLDRLSCALALNTTTDTFSIVRVDATDAAASAALTARHGMRVLDDEVIAPALARTPKYLRVLFPRSLAVLDTAYDMPYHPLDVTDPEGTEDGVDPNSYATVRDDLLASYDASGALTNYAALLARAQERAADFFRQARTTPLRRIYGLPFSDPGLQPGASLRSARHGDRGRGMVTEVKRFDGVSAGGNAGQDTAGGPLQGYDQPMPDVWEQGGQGYYLDWARSPATLVRIISQFFPGGGPLAQVVSNVCPIYEDDGGTVTSVAIDGPSIITWTGSPITTSGTFAGTLTDQGANLILAGPTSGGPAAPGFRALVTADLPAGTGTVTSVGLTAPPGWTVGGSPITGSGTITLADPLTSKGDLLTFDTQDARLGVGSNGKMLQADSTQGTGLGYSTRDFDLGGFEAKNAAEPTAASSLATRNYVDLTVNALAAKDDAQAATVTTLAAYTYTNGSSGVGAKITLTVPAVLVLDGYTPALNDRLLIKNETGGNTPYNGIYCLDDRTEILTQDGWKNCDDLRHSELVLTYNISECSTEWQPISGIHRFEVTNEEMMSLESKGHSSLSTMNHRWVTSNFRSGKQRITLSRDLTINTAILKCADCSDLPALSSVDDSLVELVAWFFTEGHIRKDPSRRQQQHNKPGTSVRIVQSAKVNAPLVERIRRCLELSFGPASPPRKLGGYRPTLPAWHERSNANGKGLVSFELNGPAGKILCDLAPDRIVRLNFLRQLTRQQLQLFVDTAIIADGSNDARGQKVIGQNNRRRLLPVEYACILLGISTTMWGPNRHGVYLLGINRNTRIAPNKKAVRYTGRVWCPSTPNGTWVARRSGTVYITGNTLTTVGIAGLTQAVLTRAVDFDHSSDGINGALVFINQGTINGKTLWYCTASTSITFGTDNINFSQFTGTTYSAGTGLSLSGTTFSLSTPVAVALGGTGTTTSTGTGSTVLSTSPSLMTPSLGAATASSLVATTTGVGTAATAAITAQNTTAAGAGAQQYSPSVLLGGQGWKTGGGGASQEVDFAIQAQPVQGSSAPTGLLAFLSQVAGGGYTTQMTLSTAGALALPIGGSTLSLAGATSGTAAVQAPATGGGTLTLPPGTDTVTGNAATQTLSAKTLTSPTINTPTIAGGTATGLTGLAVRDTSAAYDVTIGATSSTALTAGRILTLDVVNAARTVKLQGNLDIGGTLTTAAALTTVGAFAVTLTATATTNATLPAGTTTLATTDASSLTSGTLADARLSANAALAGTRSAFPQWVKYTVSYTDFSTAGTTKTITLEAAPAKTIVSAWALKASTSFQGGAIANYSISLGDAASGGTNQSIAGGTSVKGTAGDGSLQGQGDCVTTNERLLNYSTTTNLTATATSTGANLNAATQGAAEIWLLLATMP